MPRKIQIISGDSHLDFPARALDPSGAGEVARSGAPRRIKLANGDDAFIIENSRPHSPSLQITGTGTAYDKHDAKGISYEGPGTGAPRRNDYANRMKTGLMRKQPSDTHPSLPRLLARHQPTTNLIKR